MNYLKNKTLGFILQHTSRMAMALLQDRISTYNVSVGQYPILVLLWEEEGRTQKELCDLIRVEQPTLANTLKRMERDDLIIRVQDESDRRQSRIYLTKRAKDLRGTLLEQSAHVNSLFVSRLSEDEQGEFMRLLHILASTMKDELSGVESAASGDAGIFIKKDVSR